MKPDTRTVTELFERDVRYVVPLYQRPYVWNEKQQWEPLWEDILVLLEHQLSGTASSHALWSHFLGAIVLDQETQAPGTIPFYTIIDGQQRLTTLQILLAAASSIAFELEAVNDAEVLRSLTANRPLKASGDELFKVWPTNVNRSAFRAVLNPGGPDAEREDDPRNLIDEAYAYFTGRILEWQADALADISKADLMEMLRITLCDMLRMVSITLEAEDNAQVIFETLNARGTPLLALDLVKNSLFHEASRHALDVDRLYEEIWKPELDDRYWRDNRRQGRLFRPRADLFLMHWLTMKLHHVIPATELFTTFRKEILQSAPPPNMASLISELCRDAASMRSFDDQPEGSPEGLFFDRLAALDVSTVLPLVLFLFRERNLSPDSRRRALMILESWLVRRSLMRLTVKNYNMQVPVLIARLSASPRHSDAILFSELRAGAGDVSRWPTDEELVAFYEQRDAYNNIAKPRLVMALAAVERSLYSNRTEIHEIPSRLSLEHVMPQKWEEHWRIDSVVHPNDQEKAKETRAASIHKLGNLTLTTAPLNASLSNSAWPEKQRALNHETRLLLNVRLLERYSQGFDESVIAARSTELAKAFCVIWPGPQHDWGVTDLATEPENTGT